MKKLLFAILISACVLVSNVYASTVIPGVHSYNVSGAQMAGIEVSVNGTDAVTWGSTGGVTGGASDTGWSLSYNYADTYDYNWRLTTASGFTVNTLTINGAAGNIYFDIFAGLEESTALDGSGTASPINSTFNSRNGWWSEIRNQTISATNAYNPATNAFDGTALTKTADSVSGANSRFSWEFSNAIIDAPNITAIGDLFGSLTITFLGNGFTSSYGTIAANLPTAFEFRLDTDLDIRSNPVPEPATMVLFGIGLLGMTAMGRRKNN